MKQADSENSSEREKSEKSDRGSMRCKCHDPQETQDALPCAPRRPVQTPRRPPLRLQMHRRMEKFAKRCEKVCNRFLLEDLDEAEHSLEEGTQ